MRIELFSQAKYRDGSRPGDDVPLVLPGQVFGVFDGATDPRGTVVDGVPAGRLAALTVAAELAALSGPPEGRELPARDLIRRLEAGLSRRTSELELPIPPSTTVAAVLDCGADWRFLLLGDSGARINGEEILRSQKKIDEVSTRARVAVFEHLRRRAPTLDEAEYATRRAIFLGLRWAVEEGHLARATAEAIVRETVRAARLEAHGDVVADFLWGGIQTQHLHGNGSGPLAFETMNGTPSALGELIDLRRPRDEVRSIELFTDGYPSVPDAVSSAAWEEAFHRAEQSDFHKTGQFATVKGSTTTEFFDDRTILVLLDL